MLLVCAFCPPACATLSSCCLRSCCLRAFFLFLLFACARLPAVPRDCPNTPRPPTPDFTLALSVLSSESGEFERDDPNVDVHALVSARCCTCMLDMPHRPVIKLHAAHASFSLAETPVYGAGATLEEVECVAGAAGCRLSCAVLSGFLMK